MPLTTFRFTTFVLVAAVLAACSQVPTFEGNLTGRVVAPDGGPFAGARVTAASTSSGADAASLQAQALDAGHTDDEGYFDLTLPSGRYVLVIVGDGYGLTRTVEVTDERVELDLRAERLGHVRGTVAASHGGTPDGVRVRVRDTNRDALTTANGDYAVHGLPAGDYRLTANDGDGAYASDVEVSVTAGETVEAPTLELQPAAVSAPAGPEIEASSTDFMFFSDYNRVQDVPVRVELTGSGFGDRMGLNRLLYAGREVDAQAIASWSDSSIVIETVDPLPLIGSDARKYRLRALGADAEEPEGGIGPRFEVRTEAGAAMSDPVRLVELYVRSFDAAAVDVQRTIDVSARDAFRQSLTGLEFTLAANRGALQSTGATIDPNDHAQVEFTPESYLPHVITLRYAGEVVTTGFVQCCSLALDGSSYSVTAGESASITFVVEDEDGQAVGEDVTFDVVLLPEQDRYYFLGGRSAVELGTHTTGELSEIVLDLSTLEADMSYDVYLLQDGAIVGDDGWFYLEEAGLD